MLDGVDAPLAFPDTLDSYISQAEDWDNDGFGGLSLQYGGLVLGTRHGIQMGWQEFFSDATYGHLPQPNSASFSVRMIHDVAEGIVDTECDAGSGCGLLSANSVVVPSANNGAIFELLGRVGNSAAALELDDDSATCANLRARMPHTP